MWSAFYLGRGRDLDRTTAVAAARAVLRGTRPIAQPGSLHEAVRGPSLAQWFGVTHRAESSLLDRGAVPLGPPRGAAPIALKG